VALLRFSIGPTRMIPRTKQKINSSGNDRKSGGIPARPRQAFHQLALRGKTGRNKTGLTGNMGPPRFLITNRFGATMGFEGGCVGRRRCRSFGGCQKRDHGDSRRT
jgi:hypothetical protein